MERDRRGVLCDRARMWASLTPDGEISELERKLLDSHLSRCASCSAFAVEVAAVAAELRRAALERLSEPVSLRVWRRRRLVYARVRTVGAAAAVAMMAIGIAARAPLDPPDRRHTVRVTNFSDNVEREVALIVRAGRERSADPSTIRPERERGVTRPI